jgi:hypothetical protein
LRKSEVRTLSQQHALPRFIRAASQPTLPQRIEYANSALVRSKVALVDFPSRFENQCPLNAFGTAQISGQRAVVLAKQLRALYSDATEFAWGRKIVHSKYGKERRGSLPSTRGEGKTPSQRSAAPELAHHTDSC